MRNTNTISKRQKAKRKHDFFLKCARLGYYYLIIQVRGTSKVQPDIQQFKSVDKEVRYSKRLLRMQVKKQPISILSQNSFVASFSITFRKVFLGWPEYAATQKKSIFVLACRGGHIHSIVALHSI